MKPATTRTSCDNTYSRGELRFHASLKHGALYWIGQAEVTREEWEAALDKIITVVREAASDNRATTYSPREATMSDLTKQLRDPNYIGQEGMRNAAADEIDRLQSALAAAERSNDRHVDEKLTLAANLREALQQLTAAQARIAELEDRLIPSLFSQAPCFICSYNGAGYFQPSTHPCAARYHALKQPATAGAEHG